MTQRIAGTNGNRIADGFQCPGALVHHYLRWRRRRIRSSAVPRPPSLPFISGDSFRALADHVYEDGAPPFDPRRVGRGDVVFVATHLARRFFTQDHRQIEHPYVLITHNSDDHVTADLAAMMDERVLAWFAQNLVCRHPRITPIPIGLENLHYYDGGIVPDFLRLRSRVVVKRPRILQSFTVATNLAAREPAERALRDLSFVDRVVGRDSYSYRRILQRYQFVASPAGNGVDCHRTWEALYLGVIPILVDSTFARHFAALPIWRIPGWDALERCDEAMLAQKYAELAVGGFERPQLFMDFHAAELAKYRDRPGPRIGRS